MKISLGNGGIKRRFPLASSTSLREKSSFLSSSFSSSLFSSSSSSLTSFSSSSTISTSFSSSKSSQESFEQSLYELPREHSSLSLSPDQSSHENTKIKRIKNKIPHHLLVFVNKESGGKRGNSILSAIRGHLPDTHICDLSKQSPSRFLAPFTNQSDLIRVLCCGGDGTVNWILRELTHSNMSHVPVGVIPMGTGNDLVRTLESGYFPPQVGSVKHSELLKDPKKSLRRFTSPDSCEIDLWNVTISPLASSDLSQSQGIRFIASNDRLVPRLMVNYFSLGLDGAVSLAFDKLRKSNPQLFFSSLGNKAWYGLLGLNHFLSEVFGGKDRKNDLSTGQLIIRCDGKNVSIPSGTEAIIVLSVSSYMGGTKIWPSDPQLYAYLRRGVSSFKSFVSGKKLEEQDSRWAVPSASDGILEVVAVGNIVHLGIIKTGLSKGIKIAQGKKIELITPHSSPMQIDGEPWLEEPAKITLEKKGR